MDRFFDFITSLELQTVVYICLTVLLSAIMTYLCQWLLLRNQHKQQTRFAEEQRDAEKMEKTNRDQEMRDRIRQSFNHLGVGEQFTPEAGWDIYVTLKNQTPWPVFIREVYFSGPEGNLSLMTCREDDIHSKIEGLLYASNSMPPFTQCIWSARASSRFPPVELSGLFYNCVIRCEFTTIYGDVGILEIQAESPPGARLTEMWRKNQHGPDA